MNRKVSKKSLQNLTKGWGWNKGLKHSLETREKISQATKGRIPWNKKEPTKCKFCGTNVTRHQYTKCQKCHYKELKILLKNKPKTQTHRKSLSIARIKSPLTPRKEKHPSWKGGITPELEKIRKSSEYKTWRLACFERDDYTCRGCGKRGGELEVHHIKSFSEYPNLRLETENGITYCLNCHSKEDQHRHR